MKNKILLLFLIFIFLSGCAGKPDVKMVAQERITPLVVFDSLYPFTKEDNILIFAPHPDDEAIGCAGVIQKALKTGAKVNVVYLTNGDHNQFAFIVYEKRIVFRKGAFIHMGEVRRKEAVKAMELLGLKEENLVFLGYPDFGTFAIFCRFWNAEKPFRSLLTRIARVPYKDNLSYHAPYVGESVLKDLKTVLLKYKPNKIFVSHPADVNGDHKALYLYLQIALLELKNELVPPKVFPYLIHFPGWPRPRHYHPELSLQAPRQFMDSSVDWLTLEMDKEQIDKKHEAVLCYKSQTQSSAFYLLSFCRRNELFGDYPPVHLSNQISLKERAVSFFGVSALHPALDSEENGNLDNFIEDKGDVSYALVDRALLIRIQKEENMNQGLRFMVYLFGYNAKKPFADMPKCRILIRGSKLTIFDGPKRINIPQGVLLTVNKKALILKLPLEVIGDPEYILSSVKGYGGNFPLDTTGFRMIEIE